MTNAEKFVEVFGTDLKRQYSTKSWWDQEFIEQEPCEDCVSRQAAIDEIWDGVNMDIYTREVKETLESLPSVTPAEKVGHWIPVSERSPEDIKPVIITWKNTDPKSYYQYIVGKHFIGTAYYKGGKWFWYSSVTEDLLAEYGKCDSEEFDEAIEVIAWMPLPTPYKASPTRTEGGEE